MTIAEWLPWQVVHVDSTDVHNIILYQRSSLSVCYAALLISWPIRSFPKKCLCSDWLIGWMFCEWVSDKVKTRTSSEQLVNKFHLSILQFRCREMTGLMKVGERDDVITTSVQIYMYNTMLTIQKTNSPSLNPFSCTGKSDQSPATEHQGWRIQYLRSGSNP